MYTVTDTLMKRGGTDLFPSDWDWIDTGRLPSIGGRRSTTSEFGFLLRHYWIPQSILFYEIGTVQRHPNGLPVETSQTIELEMTCCNADSCTWRQKTMTTNDWMNDTIRISPFFNEPRICTYDRSEQAYRVFLPTYPNADMATLIEPRFYAMLQLPVLTPLLPIPLGFQWHVRRECDDGKNDYVNFKLESVIRDKGATILIIRKESKFTFRNYFQYNSLKKHEFRVHRSGVTAYALERAIVLEDRTLDRYIPKYVPSPVVGMETLTVRKLRSA